MPAQRQIHRSDAEGTRSPEQPVSPSTPPRQEVLEMLPYVTIYDINREFGDGRLM